jgi:hypothetical protein
MITPTETFDYRAWERVPKNRKSLLSWFFIHASVRREGKLEVPVAADGKYAISFAIEGVPVPFVGTMQDLEAQMELMINEAAHKKSTEVLHRLGYTDELRETIERLSTEIDAKLRAEFGLPRREDE